MNYPEEQEDFKHITWSGLRATTLYAVEAVDVLEVSGADRLRFLNGQVTCDVKSLPTGRQVFGFFATTKGKIESEVMVVAQEESYLLLLPSGLGETIATRLRRYILSDRVELELYQRVVLTPIGPADAGEPRRMMAPDTLPLVLAELASEGLQIADARAADQWRILSGRAKFGVDYGPENFPQEVGRDDAVSYTKGCYLGQEVIARIHYRGGVQRLLRGLILAEPVTLPAALFLGSQEVGTLHSRTPWPDHGQFLGLAIVHTKAEPGATLRVVPADGSAATQAQLVALPFT